MLEQNFTQYAISNGFPSDYDILDHGDLGPSGHVSKRARRSMQQRQSERARLNLIAHDEYNKAILSGEVVDPSSEVTKEGLLAAQQAGVGKARQSKVDGLNRNIEFIESLGRMSHKPNGQLRISYQRAVDHYKAELLAS